ncbi:MAG TPA: hypothetical protein VFP59_10775 [Candidatus Angelobacter sp.]|nr:hypothetical protein [Candidatus Angelobacter sp.]
MAHTFTKNHLHAVFSTKHRQKLIAEDLQPRLWKYVTGICQNIDLIPVAVGGMEIICISFSSSSEPQPGRCHAGHQNQFFKMDE